MKKWTIFAIFAALTAAALTLTACGGRQDQPAATASPLPSPSAPPATPEDGANGLDPTAALPDAALSAAVDALYAENAPGIMVATMPVDLNSAAWVKYYTGLTPEDAARLDAAVASEAAIGSQAYSLVLARVRDAADAPALAQKMLDGIDPQKWVCVGADTLRAASSGDTVLLVLADSNLSDAVTADGMLAAFRALHGGTLDAELTRTAAADTAAPAPLDAPAAPQGAGADGAQPGGGAAG